MNVRADRQHHAPVRVLPDIKKLDDCFADFLVRITCPCGACKEIPVSAGAPPPAGCVPERRLRIRFKWERSGLSRSEPS